MIIYFVVGGFVAFVLLAMVLSRSKGRHANDTWDTGTDTSGGSDGSHGHGGCGGGSSCGGSGCSGGGAD